MAHFFLFNKVCLSSTCEFLFYKKDVTIISVESGSVMSNKGPMPILIKNLFVSDNNGNFILYKTINYYRSEDYRKLGDPDLSFYDRIFEEQRIKEGTYSSISLLDRVPDYRWFI